MAYFALLQFEHWAPTDVANWLKGLDDSVHQYIDNFVEGQICGRKLLMLCHSDLEKLGMTKLGHQELVLEGVDLLRNLRYTVESENLQHLALQLGCKARSLYNEILARSGENDPNRANIQSGRNSRRQVSVSALSAVCDIISTMKILTSWLDRAPFETMHGLSLLRNSLVKLGLELVTVAQKEHGVIDVENAIIKACQGITEFCDELVLNTRESLVVQPASLEIATIRKKQGDELGMNIVSSYFGIHVIGYIKDMSPADLCSKIERGDEVLQVNNKTVLGWQLAKLVDALKEKPKEVVMLLKKRPRHTTPFGKVPNNKRLNTSRHVPSVATLPKQLKKRRSKDGEKPARPNLQEYVTSSVPTGDIYITKESPEDPTGVDDGNDTDNDVFRSGSESPQFTLPVIADPKQRRATVSGGSPTFERSSLVADDLDTSAAITSKGPLGHGLSLDPTPFGIQNTRPKSQAINAQEREAAIASLLAAGKGEVGGAFVRPLPLRIRKEVEKLQTNTENKSSSSEAAATTDVTIEDVESGSKVTSSVSTETITKDIEPTSPHENLPKDELDKSISSGSTQVDIGDEMLSHQEDFPQLDVGDSQIGEASAADTKADEVSTESGPEESVTGEHTASADNFEEYTIYKPTSVLRQNALGEDSPDGKSWNRSKIVSTEVAGNALKGDVPRLKRIKRLDSHDAQNLEPRMSDDEVFDKPEKKVGFADGTDVKDEPESFTHILVGGVVQKIPADRTKNPLPANEAGAVRMRTKSGGKTKLDRRVSCKDLGRGDCEGWLYKRKQKDRTLSKNWDKRWCVLKHQDLYYYKQRDALKAEGLIHLPAFQVSPANNLKTKKLVYSAFKIHNTGTTFYFASERQEDMSKWMNKLGLAAIKFETGRKAVAMGGFNRPDKLGSTSSVNRTPDYSESEDEAEESKWQGSVMSLASMSSLGSSSGSLANPSNSPLNKRHRLKDVQEKVGASTEELQAMLRSIQTHDLTIDGKDKVRQRHSQITATSDLHQVSNQTEVERLKKLHSLQRTLRAKELQLQVMDSLEQNPAAIRELQDFVDFNVSVEGSSNTSSPKST